MAVLECNVLSKVLYLTNTWISVHSFICCKPKHNGAFLIRRRRQISICQNMTSIREVYFALAKLIFNTSVMQCNFQCVYGILFCRLGVRACVVMIPLLGITWLFGLLSSLHKAFAYIFTIFNSTQVSERQLLRNTWTRLFFPTRNKNGNRYPVSARL